MTRHAYAYISLHMLDFVPHITNSGFACFHTVVIKVTTRTEREHTHPRGEVLMTHACYWI